MVPALCRSSTVPPLRCFLGVTERIGRLRADAADLFGVAVKARLVRHDAGQASIHASKYKVSCAETACGIAARKSSKSKKCPILWNILNGLLLHGYQFSHKVTLVSQWDIWDITMV
jgi:hypothetical protein